MKTLKQKRTLSKKLFRYTELAILQGLAAFAILFSINAFAGGGGLPPTDGGRHGGSCAAYDTGSEEHYGGHSSCSDCLSDHGSCEERCYEIYYECSAQGTDRNGQVLTFTATARDEYRSQDEALRRCYRDANNCSSRGCQRNGNLESRRACVRAPAPRPAPPRREPTPPRRDRDRDDHRDRDDRNGRGGNDHNRGGDNNGRGGRGGGRG